MKKAPDLWKKSQTSNTQSHYTFDVAKTEEDFLLKNSSHFIMITNSPAKRNLGEKYNVSIITLGIMVLIIVGVLGILSKIRLIREY